MRTDNASKKSGRLLARRTNSNCAAIRGDARAADVDVVTAGGDTRPGVLADCHVVAAGSIRIERIASNS